MIPVNLPKLVARVGSITPILSIMPFVLVLVIGHILIIATPIVVLLVPPIVRVHPVLVREVLVVMGVVGHAVELTQVRRGIGVH
jgi:hypothetical protein